ncbi:hypothetical protein [Paenibacillus sp. UNC451MF]|uniref:hypothetical protein n=1 Tax=Paenibacillus sp. UNC451MF TaxID=1449063 RepID=UPI00048C18F0|nr:hypothetical protein [Paenibacillus sp. UNC451MF]
MKTKQWKRRLTHTSLLAAMLTMAIGGTGSAFAADNNDQKETQATVVAQPAVKISSSFAFGSSSNMLLQPALQRNYLKLLATTYTPESLGEWKQALDERKQVESEMPKPKMASLTISKKADSNDVTGAETTDSGKKLQAFRIMLPESAAQQDTDKQNEASSSDKAETVRVQIGKEGAIMKDITQAVPVEVKDASDIIKVELPESFKRQQKLAEAVEADDAATIRSLLPEILKDYKSETDNLRKIAKEIEVDTVQPTQGNESSK